MSYEEQTIKLTTEQIDKIFVEQIKDQIDTILCYYVDESYDTLIALLKVLEYNTITGEYKDFCDMMNIDKILHNKSKPKNNNYSFWGVGE